LDLVNAHNSKKGGYQLELNKFADLSNKEFESMLGFREDLIEDKLSAGNVDAEAEAEQVLADYPVALDWRQKPGIVATMKNQASCGACYSFAAVEALQS